MSIIIYIQFRYDNFISIISATTNAEGSAMGEIWGVLAAVLSSGLGGTSIGATRFVKHAIDPLAIGAFRFGLGFIFLLPITLIQRGQWAARNDWAAVAGLGLLF